MRVGLVYDCLYPYTLGGVEHRNAEIARRLTTQDRVTLYAYDYWRSDATLKLPGCDYRSVGAARDVHFSNGKRKIVDSVSAAWGTFRGLLSSRDDVWDVANIAILPVIAAWLAAKLKRRGLVVTWHEFFGPHWNEYLGPRLGPIARRLERLALNCSPIAIAVSPQTRDRILNAGYPPQRLRTIFNGIDTELIDRTTPMTNGVELVYAGRLAPHKRVDLAIRILPNLPNARLWIIGDGPERPRLEALARELQVQDSITFHGFLPDDAEVFARMKACRVAILPSSREGFGLTAVQAWACGLPVIVCDDSENATAGLVTDPRLGTVTFANVESLAAAAKKWLNDPGDAAFRIEHARTNYGLDRMVAQVRAVYEEAARNNH